MSLRARPRLSTVPRLMTLALNHHRQGTGEPLVLIHGLGSHWQMWEPVLDELAAHHEVIALDLPGFGASPMPPAGTPAGVDSLCELVSAFLSELGVERPHIAGNSLGGMMALELGRRGQARTVCAVSPAGFFNPLETHGARTLLWSTNRLTGWLTPRANRLLARPRGRVLMMNAFVAHPERIPATEAVSMTADFANAPWFHANLAAVEPWDTARGPIPADVPVTLLWGDRDKVLWPWQGNRAVKALPGARLVPLSGCGHLPTFDDPELVAGLMLQATGAAGR
jgi:pimeloyl-ACP methyl ester carboxylesterase